MQKGQALEVMQRVLDHGNAHAFLLSGPKGVGKKVVAQEASATLLGCDVADLTRQPNVVRLSRPTDEKTGKLKKTIPVEAVEHVVAQLSLSGLGDAPKVAIIEDADALNDHGQNALLKTIEEPRGRVVIFLLAESAERILPTIRSRVVHLALFDAPDAILAGLPNAELDAAVHAFLSAPRWSRLVQAAALTKGDDAMGEALLDFYQRLALALHKELGEKCGTMSPDECRAKARALALLADTPSALAGNASQTLTLEAIALALP